MSPEKKAQIRAWLHKNIDMFIDELEAATSMSSFKQWVKDEALHERQRKVARTVDELGLNISPASTATLHEHDLPDGG